MQGSFPTIEFIGHAGAGKTFLLQKIRACFSEKGIQSFVLPPRSNISGRLKRRLSEIQILTRDVARTFRLLQLVGFDAFDKKHLSLIISAQSRIDCLRNKPSQGILLLDEGPWHALWSLTLELEKLDSDKLLTIFSSTPIPEYVVSIRVPIELCLKHLAQKENSHRLSEHPTARKLLVKQSRLLDQMEVYLETRTNLIVESTTNEESTDRIAKAIVDLILSRL